MKTGMLGVLLLFSSWVVETAVLAQAVNLTNPPSKATVELQSFENKNTSPLGAKWAFLKDPDGPLSDTISNGLTHQLARTLKEREQITVTGIGRETPSDTTLRGLPNRGFPTDTSRGTPPLGEAPKFVVSCSATMAGDKVTIEVRLIDPQTKKLISATKVEGRPEDLNHEIRERFHEGGVSTTNGPESPAEKAVRAAIAKAATWIGENTLDAVIVKASMTRVKEAPSLQSPTLVTVRQGTRLRKIGVEGEWIRIRLDNGELGWVYGEVVD